ncbi:type II toxin-antitoxin system RelE/ParE family toxin [Scytonema sp. UIC 10036]|uniref:type II toxin-antitoxin system RelE/ParE family toxin n=1 Tax=Scytonema sp. UIC 10036 TaxID=2304196 RepID=UPI0012DA02A4|nr:type II toxin-antitoxin system RelE/ParE family toxin [Scytonema sp. UIC 10036]MUG96996.1 type II toxin-antitoxin system RelE/ParE family toxin [Scytonema sp. UIC 10036]
MAFEVDVTERASQQIEEAYCWLAERNPVAANRWFNGLMTAIYSLKDSQGRCARIPEQDNFPQEIRHLIYQKKYRIIFLVQDEEETVYVLAVRHTARKPLESEDLEETL